jgi:hypothetical protein
MWRIWWTPNNVSKWQMGFNSVFKMLIMLYPFFLVITRHLKFIYRRFVTLCSIFICDVSWKNTRNEIVWVLIREKVWLANSLSQSEVGGGNGQGPTWESGRREQGPPKWRPEAVCEGETALCRSEERKVQDGRDQTFVFHVAVSFL